ncbi:neurofilament medium polypeptide-like [Portunus trituberculatus]|uniref:neurofilament medium polypeptide-like n=1 Tax=Portunus trituberculatus TaxID=210409 RepID=UPI001E1CF871|nr:neurofilament medium polypeptide-like [Portunus trituberculatus]XP_045105686.1 neurofilament medium polypeptide-like [Portunus trituberculatus]XP_045105687.1 neurofilament medium polypeptide-like [Portunus trituberculatus]
MSEGLPSPPPPEQDGGPAGKEADQKTRMPVNTLHSPPIHDQREQQQQQQQQQQHEDPHPQNNETLVVCELSVPNIDSECSVVSALKEQGEEAAASYYRDLFSSATVTGFGDEKEGNLEKVKEEEEEEEEEEKGVGFEKVKVYGGKKEEKKGVGLEEGGQHHQEEEKEEQHHQEEKKKKKRKKKEEEEEEEQQHHQEEEACDYLLSTEYMGGLADEERVSVKDEADEACSISASVSIGAEESECGNTDEVEGEQRLASEHFTETIAEHEIDSHVQGEVTECLCVNWGKVTKQHLSPPPPLPVTTTEDLEDGHGHHHHVLHDTLTLSPTQLQDIGDSVLEQTAWSTTTTLDVAQALLPLPPQHHIDSPHTWRDPIPLMPPTPPPGSSHNPVDSSGSNDDSLLEGISSSVLEETHAEDAAVGDWRDYLHIVHPATLTPSPVDTQNKAKASERTFFSDPQGTPSPATSEAGDDVEVKACLCSSLVL